MDRRAFLATSAAGAMLATTRGAIAETESPPGNTSVPLHPTGEGRLPLGPLPNTLYPDEHIEAIDKKRFKGSPGTGGVERVATGFRWAEGPAYFAAGRYLIFSDIPNNRMMRLLEDDNHLSVFRTPSYNSNGNTVDREGRLVSCEHGGRRVVRTEHDGTITVVADRYNGKRINSPNDVVVASNGSIWFTDPTYGIRGNYEGYKGEQETKEAVYRADGKTLQIDKVTDDQSGPNGICFSPDYKKVYIADTGTGRDIRIYDVDGKVLRNGKRFIQLDIPGTGAPSAAAGIRCDVDGNIWAGARPGVQVIASDGTRIGMIRLPETCANIAFGGQKRNHLFMASSQSLYAVYVGTQGAHIC